jgi:hypothetical protein
MRPWALAIIDALVDGPRPTKDVVRLAAPFVPPGRAYRRYRITPKKPGSNRPVADEAHMLASGARWVVAESIHSMSVRKPNATLLRYHVDGVEYLELTDQGKRRLGLETEVSDGREDPGDPQPD